MAITNLDRQRWLQERVTTLGREIVKQKRQPEYRSYMVRIVAAPETARAVTDAEWEVLLPDERDQLLIPYYHCLRTELLKLRELAEAPSTIDRVNRWLDQPWIKVAIATATLVEAAKLILGVLQSTGVLLIDVDDDNPFGPLPQV